MTAIENILFPVDFSPSCTAMTPFVKKAAALWGAKVSLLYVLNLAMSGFELFVRPPREVEEDCKEAAQEKLNTFLKSEFPPHETSRLLLVGDAATQISEVARKGGFGLIVMPTHAGIFRRMLLGSTTAKVLNDADCPVLTTQHADTIAPRPLDHREWFCAVGSQPDSERVLRFASQTSEILRANLTLVHVVPAREAGRPVRPEVEESVQSAEKEAARLRVEELQRTVGSDARVIIAIGPVRDALTRAASVLGADVLVIGRHPQSGMLGRMRDLTYALVRDAPCPVLSV